MLAFQGAVELGCSHLETDLRMSRDGEIVLMHDATLERTTNGAGAVSSLTLAELKGLDAGYHFSPDGRTFPARGQGHVIPTLSEVVTALPGVCLNVEIKERGRPDLPRALADFIERHALTDRIIVAAERHALVKDFRRLSHGRVATSASRRECLTFWLGARLGVTGLMSIRYQALQVPVMAGNVPFLTPRLLRAAKRRGLGVHVWTIDEPGEMHRLLDAGVDGLMSDYPDRLLDAVHERARKRAGGER